MRCIGTLVDEKQLETFVAFLVTKNISAHIERDGPEPRIWIKNEDDVATAQQLMTQFLAAPDAPEFKNVIEQAHEILRNEARKRTEARKLVKSYSAQLRFGPTYRAPLIFGLTVACVVLWIFQTFIANSNSVSREPPTERMLKSVQYRTLAFAAIPPAAMRQLQGLHHDDLQIRAYNILRGEVWRLVTPIFIHFGVAHLVFNLLALYQLGRVLENRYGTVYVGLSILAIAVISNVLQAVTPANIGGSPILGFEGALGGWGVSMFGGISGVVFGLLGMAWMKSRFDWSAGFYVPRSVVIWAIAWFLLGVSPLDEMLLHCSMANWAHGAGLVVGVIIGYLTSLQSSPGKPKSS